MTIHVLPDADRRQEKITQLRAEIRSIRAERFAALADKFTDAELATFCEVAAELVALVRGDRP